MVKIALKIARFYRALDAAEANYKKCFRVLGKAHREVESKARAQYHIDIRAAFSEYENK